jgi:hypothetical protein
MLFINFIRPAAFEKMYKVKFELHKKYGLYWPNMKRN